MLKVDIVVVINFNMNESKKISIKTNAKKEAVEGILENWIYSQLGAGKDTSKTKEREEYEIVIKLDLDGDVFHTSSDTGNKSLTCGLVMHVFSNLKKISIENIA